jgi:N-acetylglucosamine malate deacetylase 1
VPGFGGRSLLASSVLKVLDRALGSPLLRRVRQYGALRLLRRLHRISHRLPVHLRAPEQARVLVVAPHMDDDVIGPGGTLALHRKKGSSVSVVFCAAGATAEQDGARKAEARAAAAFMGFERVEWLDFPEGALSRNEEQLASALGKLIAEVAPDQIFCPYVADHHRDHSAVALALALALERSGWAGEVWSYEVWSPLWPNVAVDISSVVDIKRQAIELYTSQVAGLHYTEGTLGLNRYRALRVYVDYAEAFFVASAPEFVEMSRLMNTL